MIYDDGTRYTGKITKLEKDDEAFPSWNGAHVWWDEANSADTLNEWELEPLEGMHLLTHSPNHLLTHSPNHLGIR